MSRTVTVRVTYNGKDIKDISTLFQSDIFAAALDKMADDLFANACRYPLLVRGAAKPLVVRRVAKRQSCLWRHSFDWHNRRRGHPTHRSA